MTRWPPRRPPPLEPAPEQLARFVPAEWPGALWEAYAAWKASRREWMDAHYPDGGIGPMGDRLDMLRFDRDTRLRFSAPPDIF